MSVGIGGLGHDETLRCGGARDSGLLDSVDSGQDLECRRGELGRGGVEWVGGGRLGRWRWDRTGVTDATGLG